jgi:hypothetical protein
MIAGMSAGPHLIFDKSALECLSLDETNWLDNFSLARWFPSSASDRDPRNDLTPHSELQCWQT